MKIAALMPLALLASCQLQANEREAGTGATAAETEVVMVDQTQLTGVPADCPLTIAFGSYAMGIDGRTFAKVEALLQVRPEVQSVERHPWGKEGEVTLCVRTTSPDAAASLFNAVKALFPADPRGPLTVKTSTGLSFQAPAGSQ